MALITGRKVVVILIALFACASVSACSGDAGRSESLAFGSSADGQGGLRQLIHTQPDFTATASLQFPEESPLKQLRGFSTSYGVSKKGLTYRLDMGVVVSFERRDEAALLFYPRSREYLESPRFGIWFENALSPAVAALDAPNLVFERVGNVELDGHRCLKIQLSKKDDTSARIMYYVAEDLRNLVVKVELVDLFGTKTYTLKDISFEVSNELFQLPSDYKRCTADPTAEYRLLDLFQISEPEALSPTSFRKAVLEKLLPGSGEEAIYRYLDERIAGKDRFSSYSRASERGQIFLRIDYDPTMPGPVKKHFGVAFLLDEEKKLKDVRLSSWLTGA